MTEQQDYLKRLGRGWIIVGTTGIDGEEKWWDEEWIAWSPWNQNNPEAFANSWEGLKKKLKKFITKGDGNGKETK